jgi:ubiquinone/menaquinone biosynthesis C-methylase UbiE
MLTPDNYAAWYKKPRGQWIAEREFKIIQSMMQIKSGSSLLDVGCGTGYFSTQFSDTGLTVTGLDPDKAMIEYARDKTNNINYLIATGEFLPFTQNSFDCSIAVTSLCFTLKPQQFLSEMWRVSRSGVFLGLLNRNSLLYTQKFQQEGYSGARWDSWHDIKSWVNSLEPRPKKIHHKTTVFIPTGGLVAQLMEKIIPNCFYFGSFLAVYLKK